MAGLATTVFAARSLADPLESIRLALAEVERGNTDVEVPVYDGNEVGLLQAGFNSMVAGLRERERIRDLFGRHVGQEVAQHALARGAQLGGERREVAVLFVDLIGSTTIAADAAEVVATLNRFFAIVVQAASRHGGWVNKFKGRRRTVRVRRSRRASKPGRRSPGSRPRTPRALGAGAAHGRRRRRRLGRAGGGRQRRRRRSL